MAKVKVDVIYRTIIAMPKIERLKLYKMLQEDIDDLNILKITESSLDDWHNEEDDVYNDI